MILGYFIAPSYLVSDLAISSWRQQTFNIQLFSLGVYLLRKEIRALLRVYWIASKREGRRARMEKMNHVCVSFPKERSSQRELTFSLAAKGVFYSERCLPAYLDWVGRVGSPISAIRAIETSSWFCYECLFDYEWISNSMYGKFAPWKPIGKAIW